MSRPDGVRHELRRERLRERVHVADRDRARAGGLNPLGRRQAGQHPGRGVGARAGQELRGVEHVSSVGGQPRMLGLEGGPVLPEFEAERHERPTHRAVDRRLGQQAQAAEVTLAATSSSV
jgi:hypothetical protein